MLLIVKRYAESSWVTWSCESWLASSIGLPFSSVTIRLGNSSGSEATVAPGSMTGYAMAPDAEARISPETLISTGQYGS